MYLNYISSDECQILRQFDYAFAFYGSFFASVLKKRKRRKEKNEENEPLFEGLYLRNGLCNLLQIWYVVSVDMPAPAQQIWFSLDKRSRTGVKLYFVLHVNILMLFTYAPFPLAT